MTKLDRRVLHMRKEPGQSQPPGLDVVKAALLRALLRAPLRRFGLGRFLRLGEEVDLLSDDLAAVADLTLIVGPAGVVDAARDHHHRAPGGVFGDAFADAV